MKIDCARNFLRAATLLALVNGVAHAQSCADYPFGNGMNADAVDGGVRLIATASVAVSFDDMDAVNDERTEAGLSARAMIVGFIQEDLRSEASVRRAVQETRSMQGDSMQATRDETIQRLRNLAGSASGLVRGVVTLGECYTPGREMRVSVGIKPESIAQAESMSGQIRRSITSQPTPTAGNVQSGSPSPAGSLPQTQPPASASGPNRVPGYSDTQRLNRF
jgi:hypothetical protein